MRSNVLKMIAFVLLAGSMSVQAAPRVWTLQGVTFDDGGTATGSFVYDIDTQTYSAIDIQTTGNLAFTYTTANLLGWSKSGFGVATGWFVGAGFLDLMMVSDLTGAGGTVALGPNGVFTAPFETT